MTARASLQYSPNAPTTSTTLRLGSFAVLVNPNARGVTRGMLQRLRALVPAEDLYCSHTIHQSEFLVRRMLARGYRAIFACGGDGTISHLLNLLHAAVPAEASMPLVGILRLGTGNGVADALGYQGMRETLSALITHGEVDLKPLTLIESEGTLCPFGGCGYDAAVLSDYVAIKERVGKTPLAKALTGLSGYLIAGCFKTVPRLLTAAPPNVRVYNDGDVAYSIGATGDARRAFARGALLYEGPAMMVSAGAVPYIGYKLKMFPAAQRREGFFQLRVAQMSSLQALTRLPRIWRGQVDTRDGIHDFHATSVHVECDRAVPFQTSGDAQGQRETLSFSSSARFDFACPRLC